MSDPFADHQSGLESPASKLSAIIPDDTADLPEACRALNVGGSGTVALTTVGGTTATVYVTAGIAFPVRARRILATGTTATGIVVMW